MSVRIKVKKSDPPESKEVLALAVLKISDAMRHLLSSGLNRKAIIILIQAETRLSRRDIATVCHNLNAGIVNK